MAVEESRPWGIVECIGEERPAGSKAAEAARGSNAATSYHEWRKRAKDLRYHLNILESVWKPVIGGYLESSKGLESRLGDDHNLAVFQNLLRKTPSKYGSPAVIKALLKVSSDHQKRLRSEAGPLAERIYVEKPGVWQRRIERC